MDTELAGGLIVNPSEVKVEPASPAPSPSSTPAPSVAPLMKLEPDVLDIKQEPRGSGQSVLKPPGCPGTIVMVSSPPGHQLTRTGLSSQARLLVPKLPANTRVKLEPGERWRVGSVGNVGTVGSITPGPTKILVSGGVKSSTRRAIDTHLISSHTVSSDHHSSSGACHDLMQCKMAQYTYACIQRKLNNTPSTLSDRPAAQELT